MTPYPSPYLASLLCVLLQIMRKSVLLLTPFFLFHPSIPQTFQVIRSLNFHLRKESSVFGFITTPRGAHYWLVLLLMAYAACFLVFHANFSTQEIHQLNRQAIWHDIACNLKEHALVVDSTSRGLIWLKCREKSMCHKWFKVIPEYINVDIFVIKGMFSSTNANSNFRCLST